MNLKNPVVNYVLIGLGVVALAAAVWWTSVPIIIIIANISCMPELLFSLREVSWVCLFSNPKRKLLSSRSDGGKDGMAALVIAIPSVPNRHSTGKKCGYLTLFSL